MTDLSREAKVVQHSCQAVLMHVVEEALNVEHDGCTMKPCPVCNLYIVHQGMACIQRAEEGLCAKLRCEDQVISVNVVQHVLGNDLLQELGQAFKQGDQMVVLSHCIIIPAQLGNNHH